MKDIRGNRSGFERDHEKTCVFATPTSQSRLNINRRRAQASNIPDDLCLILRAFLRLRISGVDRRSFYKVPQFNFFSESIEKELIERRRAEWFKLFKSNDIKSKLYVCSDHFVSGKPAYLHMTEDIDWVPSFFKAAQGLAFGKFKDWEWVT
uniref:THAP-type domain-containing protein n=1 Tax=Daphnia galeata TaxID=27404 RepID=A0A8J2W3Z1_9CRUS|nr:unnamed protein product [Daphnia galeata]